METWPPPCRPAGPGASPTGPTPCPCPSTSSRPIPPRLRTDRARVSTGRPRRAAPRLHPAARSTRRWPAGSCGRFPDGPTEPQRPAWPRIAEGGDVLVASPTGTGKTLTGFLVAIDAAYRAAAARAAGHRHGAAGPGVVYVSPLRALATDVHENLQVPLAGIAEEAARLGLDRPRALGGRPDRRHAGRRAGGHAPLAPRPAGHHARVALPAADRRRRPGRCWAASTRSSSTRCTRWPGTSGAPISPSPSSGSTTWSRPGAAGCSASVSRPPSARSRWWPACCRASTRPARPTTIVDCGHRRDLDVAIELPDSELEAVASGGQLSDVLDRIAGHVLEHRTTLIFVNTRKMAERVAHQLALRLGPDDGAEDESGDRRCRRPGDRPGRRRPAGGRPPRQPVGGPPTHRGAAAPGRRPPGPGGHGLARAGHRRRARSSWSARSARPGPSAPSSSGSGGPTTSSTAHRPDGSTR